MADMGVGEMMLMGAAVGGGTAAATGGNVLQGAALGGALGGAGGYLGGLGGAAGGAEATGIIGQDIASMSAAGASQDMIAESLMANYGMSAAQAYNAMGAVASGGANALNAGIGIAASDAAAAGSGALAGANPATQATQLAAQNQVLKNPQASAGFMDDPLAWMKANPVKTALGGAGIYTLGNYLKGGNLTKPNILPAYNPVSAQSMGLGTPLSASYRPQRTFAEGGGVRVGAGSVPTAGVAPASLLNQPNSGIQSLANQYGVSPQELQQGIGALQGLGIAKAASGGLMSSPPTPGLMDSGRSGNVDFMGGDMYPQSQIQRSYYATPTQAPTSAQAAMASYEPKTNPLTGEPTQNMAAGGVASLGSYSDGGRMLKGPGDGMSDNIPATIGGKQPARLADSEFVVPADVVSHLGNGSSDAGAKQLYKMMAKVRKARTGTTKQSKQINPDKFLPK